MTGPTIQQRIGARVRAAREAAGLTRRQLAGMVGMSASAIANIENGYVRPGRDKADLIAATVGVDAAILTCADELDRPLIQRGPRGSSWSAEYFWQRVDKVGHDECWPWTAGLNDNGYGSLTFQAESALAHRVAYVLSVGPVPDGLELDHKCHDPKVCHARTSCPHRRCCNPAHLEAVTHAVNKKRGGSRLGGRLDSLTPPHSASSNAASAALPQTPVGPLSADGSQGHSHAGCGVESNRKVHMNLKSKVFAAAATLTLVGGVATVGALSAGAATPSCGHNCLDVFSRQFGTHKTPNYVMDVYRQGAHTGQPIILFRSSNSDPAQDFTVSFQGQVSDFFAAGMVSSAVELHYGAGITPTKPGGNGFPDEPAFEVEYSPYGVDSGLCAGVAGTATQNEGVTLQACGISSRTVWILDTFDKSFPAFFTGYFPAINGSDTNFSHPFVLTYPANGFPTDTPRPHLKVANLTGFSNGIGPVVGTVIDTQLWGADLGVLK